MKNSNLNSLLKATEAHRESLRKNLERRMSVARSQGNNRLLQQLQEEAAYLHLK